MKLIEYDPSIDSIKIHDELYGIIPFLDYYKTREDKNLVKTELLYVHFFYNIMSDYYIIDNLNDRKNEIKIDIGLPKNWKEDGALKKFIIFYLKRSETPAGSILDVTYELANKIKTYIREIDLYEIDKSGKPIHNLKDTIDTSKKLTDLMDTIRDAENKYRESIKVKERIRGGGELSEFEDGVNINDEEIDEDLI